MSSQTGSLRKAPLSAETLENCIMTELNIVNFIIQTTYIILMQLFCPCLTRSNGSETSLRIESLKE